MRVGRAGQFQSGRNILDLLAAGLDQHQVLAELPDLEAEDITAALLYARRRLDHPVLAA